MVLSSLRSRFAKVGSSARGPVRAVVGRPHRRRPGVEALEERALPSGLSLFDHLGNPLTSVSVDAVSPFGLRLQAGSIERLPFPGLSPFWSETRAVPSSPAPSDDFGNSLETAATLAVSPFGESYRTGSIETAGDIDLFRFTSPFSGQLRIRLGAIGTRGLDSVLTVLDSSGRLLAADDNSGGARNSLVRVGAVEGATYYLQAGGSGSSVGDYLLSALPLPRVFAASDLVPTSGQLQFPVSHPATPNASDSASASTQKSVTFGELFGFEGASRSGSPGRRRDWAIANPGSDSDPGLAAAQQLAQPRETGLTQSRTAERAGIRTGDAPHSQGEGGAENLVMSSILRQLLASPELEEVSAASSELEAGRHLAVARFAFQNVSAGETASIPQGERRPVSILEGLPVSVWRDSGPEPIPSGNGRGPSALQLLPFRGSPLIPGEGLSPDDAAGNDWGRLETDSDGEDAVAALVAARHPEARPAQNEPRREGDWTLVLALSLITAVVCRQVWGSEYSPRDRAPSIS